MKTVTQQEFAAHIAQFSTVVEEERDQGYLYETYTDRDTGREVAYIIHHMPADEPEYRISE